MADSDKIITVIDRGKGLLAIAAVGYVASLFVAYTPIEDAQRTIRDHNPGIEAQIDFENLYNPLRFWKDNKDLLDEATRIRKENPGPPGPFRGGIPTIG